MPRRDALNGSVLARPAGARLLVVAVLLGVLWLAVLWAVSLP